MSRRNALLSRHRLSRSGYALRYSATGSGDSEPRMKCRGDVGNGKAEAGARGGVQAGGPGGGLRGGTSEAAARGKLKLRGSSLRGEHSLKGVQTASVGKKNRQRRRVHNRIRFENESDEGSRGVVGYENESVYSRNAVMSHR